MPLLVLRARRLRWLALVGLVGTSCVTTNDLVPSECQRDTDCDKDACPIGQAPVCVVASHMCQCVTTIKVGMLGSFSDVAVTSTGTAWVSAYNTDYGDLMVAQSSAMGRIADTVWEFADGVPMAPPANPYSTVRGGINEPGDDVGRFTSIAVNAAGDPSVSHYDKTNQSLRYSARVAGKWTSYAVDVGAANSKNVGLYTTLSFDATGKPGIGYLAILKDGNNIRSEVRWAQAKTTAPAAQSDWAVTVVEAKAAPADPAMGMLNDVPYVNGVFINSARTATGEPVLVFYDRPNGNLKLAQWDPGQSKFKVPVVIDGAEGKEDMGWYPSVAATSDGKLAVAYVDAKRTNLLALIYPGGLPEVVDDGLRMDGTTSDGLPRPVYHFVGDNSQIVAKGTSLSIVYQDATAQELLVATKGASAWAYTKLAGSDTPYKGAYGFFAAGALSGSDLVMSTFALNQTTYEMWVELFKKTL